MTKSKRILVTGGSGFIGTNLIAELLSQGHEVQNIDVKAPQAGQQIQHWVAGDVCDSTQLSRILREFRPAEVVHLAARTDLLETKDVAGYSVNYDGTESLIRSMKGVTSIERVIFASTMLVNPPGHVPTRDDDYCPHTLYGLSKVMMEKQIRASSDRLSSWCIVRPTTVWGPWFGRHYQNFFKLISRGRYFTIRGRNPLRTLGFVGTVVDQISALLMADGSHMRERVFYVGDPSPTRLGDWAEEIRRQLRAPSIRAVPYSVAMAMGAIGDVLIALKVPAPYSSFRLRNLTTDWVLPMKPILDLAPESRTTLETEVSATIHWLRERGAIRARGAADHHPV